MAYLVQQVTFGTAPIVKNILLQNIYSRRYTNANKSSREEYLKLLLVLLQLFCNAWKKYFKCFRSYILKKFKTKKYMNLHPTSLKCYRS